MVLNSSAIKPVGNLGRGSGANDTSGNGEINNEEILRDMAALPMTMAEASVSLLMEKYSNLRGTKVEEVLKRVVKKMAGNGLSAVNNIMSSEKTAAYEILTGMGDKRTELKELTDFLREHGIQYDGMSLTRDETGLFTIGYTGKDANIRQVIGEANTEFGTIHLTNSALETRVGNLLGDIQTITGERNGYKTRAETAEERVERIKENSRKDSFEMQREYLRTIFEARNERIELESLLSEARKTSYKPGEDGFSIVAEDGQRYVPARMLTQTRGVVSTGSETLPVLMQISVRENAVSFARDMLTSELELRVSDLGFEVSELNEQLRLAKEAYEHLSIEKGGVEAQKETLTAHNQTLSARVGEVENYNLNLASMNDALTRNNQGYQRLLTGKQEQLEKREEALRYKGNMLSLALKHKRRLSGIARVCYDKWKGNETTLAQTQSHLALAQESYDNLDRAYNQMLITHQQAERYVGELRISVDEKGQQIHVLEGDKSSVKVIKGVQSRIIEGLRETIRLRDEELSGEKQGRQNDRLVYLNKLQVIGERLAGLGYIAEDALQYITQVDTRVDGLDKLLTDGSQNGTATRR